MTTAMVIVWITLFLPSILKLQTYLGTFLNAICTTKKHTLQIYHFQLTIISLALFLFLFIMIVFDAYGACVSERRGGAQEVRRQHCRFGSLLPLQSCCQLSALL